MNLCFGVLTTDADIKLRKISDRHRGEPHEHSKKIFAADRHPIHILIPGRAGLRPMREDQVADSGVHQPHFQYSVDCCAPNGPTTGILDQENPLECLPKSSIWILLQAVGGR